MSKAFSKKIEPKCEYCVHGRPCKNTDLVVCKKRGVVNDDESCSSFKYDPILRTPQEILIVPQLSKEDFEI